MDVTGSGDWIPASILRERQLNHVHHEHKANWTEVTMPSSANWQAVVYSNGKLIAVDVGSNTDTGAVFYSTDGVNWTPALRNEIDMANTKFTGQDAKVTFKNSSYLIKEQEMQDSPELDAFLRTFKSGAQRQPLR